MNKSLKIFLFFIFVIGLTFCAGTFVQAVQPSIQQMVADLQKTPEDQTLRENIIRAVLSSGNTPEVPAEALKQVGEAKGILSEARSPEDYKEAVKAFKKASLLAPWYGDIYYDLAVVQEKAGQPKDAIKCLNFYLLAAPNAKDKNQVLEKIGTLSYKARKKVATKSEKKAKSEIRSIAKKLEGNWQYVGGNSSTYTLKVVGDNFKLFADRSVMYPTGYLIEEGTIDGYTFKGFTYLKTDTQNGNLFINCLGQYMKLSIRGNDKWGF